MRSGNDEQKQMDPLFPRLHINDTEKGGPKAPPRNKMALCEEINIPAQRSSSGSISMRLLPPVKESGLVPSGSQSHVGCPQKSVFSSFCSVPGSLKMDEKHHSYSSTLVNFDTRSINPEIRILKPGNSQTYSTSGPPKMIAKCHLFRPFSFYNSVNSSVKTLSKEDDFSVPYFAQLDKTLHCGGIGHKLENKKLTSSSLSSSGKHQIASERKEEELRSTDLKSREHLRDRTDDNPEVSPMSEEKAETPPLLAPGKKILADAAAIQLTRNITSKSGTRALVPTLQARCTLANDAIRLHDPCAQSHQECRTSPENTASTTGIFGNLERFSRKRSYSTIEGPSCSSAHPGENNRTPNILESVNECTRGNDSEVGDAGRSFAFSDASAVDSKSFNMSPDDVVGVIGLKLFWRVRRTIAHQQRIFALQIFELHRLIKVQRLIAESPEMLSVDTLLIRKPSIKCSPVKKLPSQNIPEATSPLIKPKVDSQKPNSSLKTAAEDAQVKLPSPKCDSEKGRVTPKSTLKPYSGSSTSTSFVSHVKLGPRYFHPGSQWLVPVRSPSEGLVYKPYTGPCPPSAGCIAPVYGSCGPTSLTAMDRDFMNTTYGIPAPSQQGARFQPYATPVVDTSNSSTNLPASKGSDFHGSTASSPFESLQGDALSLFPITPTVQTSHKPVPSNNSKQQRTQVIKVVPHNPKSACESAARIFRFIQEERQKHD